MHLELRWLRKFGSLDVLQYREIDEEDHGTWPREGLWSDVPIEVWKPEG